METFTSDGNINISIELFTSSINSSMETFTTEGNINLSMEKLTFEGKGNIYL